MKQYKTLDQLKEGFKKTYAEDKILYQSDVMDALEHLDLSDTESAELYDWFAKEGIKLSDDDEEPEEIEEAPMEPTGTDADNDLDVFEEDGGSDEFEEDDDLNAELMNIEASFANSTYTKTNDAVKMYLKEIGRIPLLNPEDEPDIARRCAEGDQAAKEILISSNLRLVVSTGSGRSPEGGHGNPFQYSCLENPMDRGAWQARVHGVAKRWT